MGKRRRGQPQAAWNRGRLVGQKPPLRIRDVWAVRSRLELAGSKRDLAMFNLAIDSKLPGCDLTALRWSDVAQEGRIRLRAVVLQRKTRRPVQFEITDQSRDALAKWRQVSRVSSNGCVFPGRTDERAISVRQYARLVKKWTASIGLDAPAFGTHSLRRTKPAPIYRRTGILRAVQLLLGHTKLDSTVRYLGIEVEDALAIAEQLDPQALTVGRFGSDADIGATNAVPTTPS